MTAQLIDGKNTAHKIRQSIKQEVQKLKEKGLMPGLAVILIGDDKASMLYVSNKEKACREVGFYSEVYRLASETSQAILLEIIERLNNDGKIHGILIQLPLPAHINEKVIIDAISPEKDVDGFHPLNAGALMVGRKGIQACTPKGCVRLIKDLEIEISGKKVVVIGRSNIVGKPLAIMLLQENATVTICHSKTINLLEEVKQADIIIAAVGRPYLITGKMLKNGAIVIDVGITRLKNGRLVGDVDYESVKEIAGWITPVPGGVGPMTIAMLLENTLQAAKVQKGA